MEKNNLNNKLSKKSDDIIDNKNELKIELYPENIPRGIFERTPIKESIPKNALAHSFDINKNYGYLSYNVPILRGFYDAYINHYPVRIKPDDIWLLIVQAFSHHVNNNSEELRNMLVNFEYKKTIEIENNINDIRDINKSLLEKFSKDINEKLKEYLGEELLETLTPNFSTTNYDTSIVCKISIMAVFKKYFNYTMLRGAVCGIPYIILEGTAEDYEKIVDKAKKLKKYEFEWYIDRIIPHVQKMAEAKNGKVDINFFRNVIQNKEETEYHSNDCLPGGYEEQEYFVRGWILSFFAYDKENSKFYNDRIKLEEFEKLASQWLNVPFQVKTGNEVVNLEYNVGFYGCDQNKKLEVFPVIGWIVSPFKEEILEPEKMDPLNRLYYSIEKLRKLEAQRQTKDEKIFAEKFEDEKKFIEKTEKEDRSKDKKQKQGKFGFLTGFLVFLFAVFLYLFFNFKRENNNN